MVKKKKGKAGNDAKERKSVQISSEITPFIDADEYFRRQYRHDFCLEAVQENNKAFAGIISKSLVISRIESDFIISNKGEI